MADPTPKQPEPSADLSTADAGQPATKGHDAMEVAASTARVRELEHQLAELNDAFLRAKAETENIRRRADEETSKARKFAIESFADNLLPVRDSLEAALANAKASPDKLIEGVETTLRQLSSAFERNKLIEIAPAAGTKFDPHHHQAISAVPSDLDANTVVTVLQKGYLIADRVLRPALVTVSAPK